MHRGMDIPLVGPGNELQLTIDGRAVPHAEVVQAARTATAPADDPPPAPDRVPADDEQAVPPEQTRLPAG